MTLNTLLLFDFQHKKGDEIRMKHKEAIRQLHWFEKVLICAIANRYKLSASTIRKILRYSNPERHRPDRTGFAYLLSNAQVDEIILYCAEI
ncbi:hypothetical protein BDZ45DRAFT_681677, partial [Acephala macrosclerotiorum]